MVLSELLNMVSTKTLTITLSHNARHTNNLRITRILTRFLNNINSHTHSQSICHRLSNSHHNSRAAAGSAVEAPSVGLQFLKQTEMLGAMLGPIGKTV